MAEKTKKNKAAIRKNVLYIAWVAALVAVMATAIIVVASVTNKEPDNLLDNSGTSSSPQQSDTGSENPTPDSGSDSGNQTPDDGNQGNAGTEELPVVGKITFIMPCQGSTVIKDYTADTVVFNSTLNAYMGHLAVDFAADKGTEVHCVYDGTVESITTSYLTGTTVVVNHGGELKTVYNSIDANEALYEGCRVSQGDVIGTVSDNNLQEVKDGPHLHFEVIKSGKKIDPDEYLIGEEK